MSEKKHTLVISNFRDAGQGSAGNTEETWRACLWYLWWFAGALPAACMYYFAYHYVINMLTLRVVH